MGAPGWSAVLAAVNEAEGTTFKLVKPLQGGLQGGVWRISDGEGRQAVLKWTSNPALIRRREETSQLVARLIEGHYPTPRWLYTGTLGGAVAYSVVEWVQGRPASWSTLPLDQLMAAIELQAGVAPRASETWSDHIRFLLDAEEGPRGLVASLGRRGQRFLQAVDASLPGRDTVKLPVEDAVHGDMHVDNVLVRHEGLAIVDIDACGAGTRVIDYAWLYRDAWTRGAEASIRSRIRAQGERIHGRDTFQLCLTASALDLMAFVARQSGVETALPYLTTLHDMLHAP